MKYMKRKVICAATVLPSGLMLVGARHADKAMLAQAKAAGQKYALTNRADNEGFIDQFAVFMTREEAWIIASEAGQIVRRVGGDGERLYSENLY